MARKFTPIPPSLSYVRCAVSMRKGTLEEALGILGRDENDVGVVRMRAQISTCAWVLGLIDGKVEG